MVEFWESTAGAITAWSAALVSAAAAARSLAYLIRSGRAGFKVAHRATNAVRRLAAIGDEDAWPNGSTDLPTFLHGMHTALMTHLSDHETGAV